jgi:hypothetical protein
MTNEDLKPCQLCGGKAALDRESVPYGLPFWAVRCTVCKASTRPMQGDCSGVVEAWNMRVAE